LSPTRGQITTAASTNTIIVSDIDRVQTAVSTLLSSLDRAIPQVQITAKIIFVNRTELSELGVRYELKDSQGNQLNALSSGGADFNGDGVIDLSEAVPQGQAVVLLGGSSIAAIGNAAQAVGSPTLQLLASLALGRHQLISFVDALNSVNLSDIQAEPSITTLDNQQARIHVGEITPIRTIDAGTGGAAAGATFPTAQVAEQETGIILEVTPHVTGDQILLELVAERSAAEIASSDVGFIFNTQRVETRVIVQDGETVVSGGLTQTEISESRSGIPILMDLPLVGRLFRVTRQNQIQRDLIILVTPHIVRPLN
jgi:type IV pilus assembly protein PilQ